VALKLLTPVATPPPPPAPGDTLHNTTRFGLRAAKDKRMHVKQHHGRRESIVDKCMSGEGVPNVSEKKLSIRVQLHKR
jgi:hypothetical protein